MINIDASSLIYTLKSIVYPVCIFSLIFLLIVPVMATDDSILNKSPRKFPIIQKEINAEIAEKIATKEIISNKIAEQEKLLSEGFLKINDGNATKITTNGLVVKTNDNTNFSNKKSDVSSFSEGDIPEGGIVNFGNDGKTRIFASNGIEVSLLNDAGTEDIILNSNELSSLRHSISVPSGATIQDAGKNTYVIYEGKIVLTIVNDRYNKDSTYVSKKYENGTVPKKDLSFSPETKGGSWIAWVQYKPSTEIKLFSADWMLPFCPSVPNNITPAAVPNNIIFNGIEPSDGSIILQPVTAFNYNKFQTDVGLNWENNWYGSAFIESDSHGLDLHSTPIHLHTGNWVNGFVYYIADMNEWVVLLSADGQTTQKQYSYLYYHIDPTNVDLVATYEAWFNDTRFSNHYPVPSDQAKCGNIKFENLKAWDEYIHEIPITWISYSTPNTLVHPGLTGISIDNTTHAPDQVTIYTSPPSPPGAYFVTDSERTGTAPLAAAFRDTSENTPTSWNWNFGDGQTSTERNPVHIYATNGSFDVSLNASNSGGSSTFTRSNWIDAGSPLPNERVTNGNCDNTASWLTEGDSGTGGTWAPAKYVSSGGQTGGYLQMDVNGGTSGWANSAIYQDIDLTNVNTLTYYLRTIGSTISGSKTIYVYLDNNIIRTIPSPSGLTSWTQYSHPVCGYSGIHMIKFYTSISNTGSEGWMKVGVDTVSAMAQIATPIAEFSASQTSGTVPFTVQFTDASTNNPTAWAWDFGDDHASIEKNPSHIFTSPGTHTVKLTAANTAGANVNIKTDYITTNPLTFTITASAAPGGNITPSGLVNVIRGEDQMFFITSSPGYIIDKVMVDGNDLGAISSYYFWDVQSAHSISATFRQNLPVANFTATPTNGTVPLTVQFNDTSTNNPATWNWSFGDGSTSTAQNPSHVYLSAGTYTVSLTVTNPAGSNSNIQPDYIIASEILSSWNWSTDGWSGWGHNATYSGSTTGPNTEFGPVIVNDHGEHGIDIHLRAGSATSWVCRTFLNPSGNGWNTLSFTGVMSGSSVPSGRWMTIEVNGQQVFGGTATQTPPGNGQMFQIQKKFTKSDNVTVKITNGQNPAWSGAFKLHYYSLKLENTSFSITSTAGSGGSISPTSIVYITQGGNQSYSITPNPGYSIADVRINGISNGSISAYTFSNVQANQTIDALFRRTNWNWSRDGWAGWNHRIQVTGNPSGPNTEYGPVIVNGHGEHGASIHLYGGSAKYWVWRTFTDPSGIGWNTVRFDGFNSATDTPRGKIVAIEVNGQQVFSGASTQMPPGNGQFFTVQRSFPQSSIITVNITGIQNPAWSGIFMLQYYSLNITQEGTALMSMQKTQSVTTEDDTMEKTGLITNTTNTVKEYISFVSTPAIIPDDNYSEAQSTENNADLIVTQEASGLTRPFIIPDSDSPEVKRLITNSTARGAKDVRDKNH